LAFKICFFFYVKLRLFLCCFPLTSSTFIVAYAGSQQTVADIIGRPDGCPIRSDKGV
jgi:glycopeptide antibiotics resistance protein